MNGSRDRERRLRQRAGLLIAAAVVAGGLALIVAYVKPGGGPSVSTQRTPGTLPPAVPGGELWDARSTQVFDTEVPFGAGRVPLARFRWPVKPFDRQHVLRATFGEPRGLLDDGIRARGAGLARLLGRADQLEPIGRRVIHTGVDIVAADGTPVYAVESGVARTGGATWDQFTIVGKYGYWHLSNPVPTGTKVIAFVTQIGTVYPGQGHVHLTRFARAGSAPVNPLVSGGLEPYRDTSPPIIDRVVAFDRQGRDIPLGSVSGPVVLAVKAADVQTVGRTMTGLYRLGYSLVPATGGGRPVVGPTEVFRFDVVPSQAAGDIAYTLGSTRHRFETDFWYRITDRTPSADGFLHTERLSPGDYELLINAADGKGNETQRRFPIRVLG